MRKHGSTYPCASRRVFLVRLTVLAALALTLGACSEEVHFETGAIELLWAPGPAASCLDVGLERVEIQLRQRDNIAASRSFTCAEGGAYLQDVAPGRYDVLVLGVDHVGVRTFEGALTDIAIKEGEHVHLGTVRMTARPAQVELMWFFENGRLCRQNNVDKVRVDVYDANFYFVSTSEFACEEGAGSIEPLAAGTYVLEVQGLGNGDEPRARGVVDIVVERGEDLVVDASLDLSFH